MTIFKYKDRLGKKPNESEKRELDKIKWYEEKVKEFKLKLNENI